MLMLIHRPRGDPGEPRRPATCSAMRVRDAAAPRRQVGLRRSTWTGKILVAGRSTGAAAVHPHRVEHAPGRRLPRPSSWPEGRHSDLLDGAPDPADRGAPTDAGRDQRRGRGRTAPRLRPGRPRATTVTRSSRTRRSCEKRAGVGAEGRHVIRGRRVRARGCSRRAQLEARPTSVVAATGDDEDNLRDRRCSRSRSSPCPACSRVNHPDERVAVHRAVGRGRWRSRRRTSSRRWWRKRSRSATSSACCRSSGRDLDRRAGRSRPTRLSAGRPCTELRLPPDATIVAIIRETTS